MIYSIDFSADGRYIAAAPEDDNIIIWQLDSGKLIHGFYGHTDDVMTVQLGRIHASLVSGGYNSTGRVWDVNTGQELQRFETSTAVFAVNFDPEREIVYTSDADGNFQEWQIRDLPALLQ